ncbi:ABC transporter permease [Mucilaginibacter sp. Bleaf8]|uniref:ABC transporter permease n=1 Tax=Mucilaginibacter sp. Bleaf8 TaxID=2834430 RepID=UPI001BCCE92D|nr:ABC transporter permease [Mucilaginibacter sp. Bleaf8]MBS7567073.1 ABC transporter permease [Mucilaginibacter sp. Bleaf8]
MNVLTIAIKNLQANKLNAFLNLLLVAFGIAILTVLLSAGKQINDKLEKNAKDIDLVVGAKGSPLQLVLSSIYYIDFPTGNIPLSDAQALAANPLVKRAVPLALGDNYSGYRIVGTDTSFVNLYGLTVAKGRFWQNTFEVTIGANVAAAQKLSIGSEFYGAHGLTGQSDVHKAHAYKVTGILKPQNNVVDNLVLTNIASVWGMHETAEEHQEKETHNPGEPEAFERGEKEITTLLIQYRSPMSVVLFPRMVNQSTNMQAASPAMESARLFSLIGIGVDTLQWFAVLIMVISGVSVFVSLYNSLKERRYDLAVMRTIGASRLNLFSLIVLEGAVLTLIGSIIGLLFGHLTLQLIGHFQASGQARLSGLIFDPAELYLIVTGLLIGFAAALLPALQAYRTDIAGTLSEG